MKLPDIFNKRAVKELKEEVQRLKEPKGFESYARGYEKVATRPSRLTWTELWDCYIRSSAVRAAVDYNVRSVTSHDYEFLPKPGMTTSDKRIREVVEFFNNPNANDETFRQLLAKVLTDVLVYDAGVIEKVYSAANKKKLLEIYARDGSTFRPIIDQEKHGVLIGYQQYWGVDKAVEFDKDEIIYLMMYPNTKSPYGQPIIESIVDEVASLLFANEQVADSFTMDEIPPGILNLGMIGKEAYKRAQARFRERRGERSKREMNIVYGTTGVEWIDFKRANREMQLDELRRSIERVIFRNFGLQPIEYGAVSDVNRSTALFQLRIAENRMLIPLINMLTTYINKDILEASGYPELQIHFIRKMYEDEEAESRAASRYVKTGIKTINEVRAEKGKEAIDGGDDAFMVIGKDLIFVKDLKEEGVTGSQDDGHKEKAPKLDNKEFKVSET